jgi:multidrug efflux pump subunit AcrA (membrane-fusion protein)
MSTVGKVLVVAQVAFSLLLMAFAAGVSSVQTNWKTKYETANTNLTKANTDIKSLHEEVDKAVTAQKASEKTLKDAAATAQGKADAAQDRIKRLETELTQARTELQNMRAEAKIAGDESRARRDESMALREINAQLHQKGDELLGQNRQQEDKIADLEQRSRSMIQTHNQWLQNYATLEKFIRMKGWNPDPKELAGETEPPPIVQGVVIDSKKGGRNGTDLVEISEGSDVGLARGNELFVYRNEGQRGKYLGKIRLSDVGYRTSVGEVVQSTKNGDIRRGDNVTTKL